jgi:hypothetical protein
LKAVRKHAATSRSEGSPGTAIPLKAISIGFCEGRRIFEGLREL